MLTKIKLARLQKGVAQIRLALQIGMHPSRLSRIECGYIEPSPDEIDLIAAALGVPPNALRASPSDLAAPAADDSSASVASTAAAVEENGR